LLQDLTSSRKDLEDAIRDLDVPALGRPQLGRRGGSGGGGGGPQGRGQGQRSGIGTTLYDSLFLATDEVLKKQDGRKAVILLTDGVDQGSKESLLTAIETSQRADTLAYCIRFYDAGMYGGAAQGPVGFPRGGGRRGRGGIGFPGPGGGGPRPGLNR